MYPTGGLSVKPMYITRIEDKNGNVLQSFTSDRKEVISANTAYSIMTMMNGVMTRGTGRRASSYGINVANFSGKTGTTNDNSDAWFMGYSPQLLCGVWTGCDDRFIRFSSTAVGQGSSLALPVWAYFYSSCLKDRTTGLDSKVAFPRPEGYVIDTLPPDAFKPPTDTVEGGGAPTGTEY
jgi:penicillin-binding protein 1A